MKASQIETLQVGAVVAAVVAIAALRFRLGAAAVTALGAVVAVVLLDKSRPAYKIRALPPPPARPDVAVEWEDDPPDGPVSGYFTDAGEWISGAGNYIEGIEDWISDNPF